MAEANNGNTVRRRTVVNETYGRKVETLSEFVENYVTAPPGGGGGGSPNPIPDTTDWEKQRKSTIRTLKELRKKLDNTCVYCNYAKGAGDVAEITGAATSIAAALMALNGCSSADTVMNVGNLLQHSGALVGGVSNVAESLLSNKYLREVEAVLKKDQELSRPLLNWLITSANLNATIRELFGCDLSSARLGSVLKTFGEFSRICMNGLDFNTTLDILKSGEYSVHVGNGVVLENLQTLFRELSVVPALAARFSTALSVLSGATLFLQAARSMFAVYECLGGKRSDVLPLLKGGINPQIPATGDVSMFCVFQGIHIATRIVSLTNVVRVVRSGKSNYSDALEQLSDLLQIELDTMETLTARRN